MGGVVIFLLVVLVIIVIVAALALSGVGGGLSMRRTGGAASDREVGIEGGGGEGPRPAHIEPNREQQAKESVVSPESARPGAASTD